MARQSIEHRRFGILKELNYSAKIGPNHDSTQQSDISQKPIWIEHRQKRYKERKVNHYR